MGRVGSAAGASSAGFCTWFVSSSEYWNPAKAGGQTERHPQSKAQGRGHTGGQVWPEAAVEAESRGHTRAATVHGKRAVLAGASWEERCTWLTESVGAGGRGRGPQLARQATGWHWACGTLVHDEKLVRKVGWKQWIVGFYFLLRHLGPICWAVMSHRRF